MKKILVAILAATVFWQAKAAGSAWLTDLPAAQAQAKTEHKMVLMDFTGSDWCPWCIKFKKEVLDSKKFQAYAAKSVVLVELDFPKSKPQTDDLKQANGALKAKYGIEGFPTLIVLDQNGKEIGRQVGYEDGGPKAFIAQLEKYQAGK
jgi:protein disulfide-isomerase